MGRSWTVGLRALVVSVLMLAGLQVVAVQPVSAAAWTLTAAQRQAYLYHYAPVLMKRGDENNDKEGRDWITNFDFDQDANFADNRTNWLRIDDYVTASAAGPHSVYGRWRIRPTMYTSLVEYLNGTSKSLVLFYHVYNAADKDGGDIHDWERVEIAVHGVTGTPGGSGEHVNHATVTLHHDHIMRRYGHSELNSMQSASGRHLLLWQADECRTIDPSDTHAQELRFVTNTYSWIASRLSTPTVDAEVNVSGKDEKKNVHYVFVPERSQSAITAFGARALNYANASTLASRADNGTTVAWSRVKRITYELQDLADIFPTHWSNNPSWSIHWLSSKAVDVTLESPIVNEAGVAEVNTGRQRFYARSRDTGADDLTDGRDGYPDKNWYFGAYSAEENYDIGSDDFKAYEGLGTDSFGRTRGAASGQYGSHNAYWWQHDYFVHSGAIDTADTREAGQWLVGAWYTTANGGFDGRRVQLFADRPGLESGAP